MGDLSPHFSRREFADHRTGEAMVERALYEALERLRAIVRRPIVIVSGYRSPATNRAVGGAAASQHLLGRAADLHPFVATLGQAEQAGFTGIGVKRDAKTGVKWVTHVDVRPGHRAIWYYPPIRR